MKNWHLFAPQYVSMLCHLKSRRKSPVRTVEFGIDYAKVYYENAALVGLGGISENAFMLQMAVNKRFEVKVMGCKNDAKKLEKILYKNWKIVQYRDRCL